METTKQLTPRSSWRLGQPLPHSGTLETASHVVSEMYFPVSPRSMERWDLATRVVNKRTIVEIAEVVAVARQMLESAPQVRRGGR